MSEYQREGIITTADGVPVRGYASGDFLTCVRDGEGNTETTGSHGEVTVNRMTDPGGLVTLTLQGGAKSNDFLQGFAPRPQLPRRKFIFLVKDNNGRKLIFSPDAYIKKEPDIAFGDEIKPVVWEIRCPTLDMSQGGND